MEKVVEEAAAKSAAKMEKYCEEAENACLDRLTKWWPVYVLCKVILSLGFALPGAYLCDNGTFMPGIILLVAGCFIAVGRLI